MLTKLFFGINSTEWFMVSPEATKDVAVPLPMHSSCEQCHVKTCASQIADWSCGWNRRRLVALNFCLWKRTEERWSLHLCNCSQSSFVSQKLFPLLCTGIVDVVFYTPLIPSRKPPRGAGQCSLLTGEVLSVTRNGPFFWVSLNGPSWKSTERIQESRLQTRASQSYPI